MPPFELYLEEPRRPPVKRTIQLPSEESALRLLLRLVRTVADKTSDGFAVRIARPSGAPICSFELTRGDDDV